MLIRRAKNAAITATLTAIALGLVSLPCGPVAPARAEEKPTSRKAATRAAADLPLPRIGVRQQDEAPFYSWKWTFLWVDVPEIPRCVLDLCCYEHYAHN